MDNRIDAIECCRIELGSERVPADRVRLRLAADDPHDLVPAGRQQWYQFAANQAVGASDRDAHAFSFGIPGVSQQVGRRRAMAIGKHLFDLSSDKALPEELDEESARQPVFDVVLEHRSLASGCESVGMIPLGERPFPLDVSKVPSRFVVAVFSDPSQTQWPEGVDQHHAAAVFYAISTLDYFHVFPGRNESIQGTRACMPGERIVHRHGKLQLP